MRILFLGTAELACPCLEAVGALPAHAIVGVITQPDRPKGRDLKLSAPPVKLTAQRLDLSVHQPAKLRDPAAVELVRALQPELIIVVAYGQILPQAVLDIPPRGCINVHTSLLPRWRGAAPIQHALLAGDAETGVTTMYLDEQMDHGDIILQRREPIRPDDTSATLHGRLAAAGAELLVETLKLLTTAQAPRRRQDETAATYATKLTKEHGRIDWTRPAVAIERQVRAFDPWPGAFTVVDGAVLKVWHTAVVPTPAGPPGELRGNVVATGDGGLRILEVQPAGGRRMTFEAFRRGHGLTPGCVLG